jgi:hypothetical protein
MHNFQQRRIVQMPTLNDSRRRMDSGERTEVLAAADRFRSTSMDEIVSYDDLSQAVGCDVREKRWIVLQALDLVNKEGIVFTNVSGVGYRRLAQEAGIRHAGEKAMKRTRSAARRGRKRLENALHHANDLSPAEQRRANQRLAALGLVEHLTKAKAVRMMPDEPPKKAHDNLAGLKAALGL